MSSVLSFELESFDFQSNTPTKRAFRDILVPKFQRVVRLMERAEEDDGNDEEIEEAIRECGGAQEAILSQLIIEAMELSRRLRDEVDRASRRDEALHGEKRIGRGVPLHEHLCQQEPGSPCAECDFGPEPTQEGKR